MTEKQLRLIAVVAMVAIAASAIVGAVAFAGYARCFDTLSAQQRFHDRNADASWTKWGD